MSLCCSQGLGSSPSCRLCVKGSGEQLQIGSTPSIARNAECGGGAFLCGMEIEGGFYYVCGMEFVCCHAMFQATILHYTKNGLSCLLPCILNLFKACKMAATRTSLFFTFSYNQDVCGLKNLL